MPDAPPVARARNPSKSGISGLPEVLPLAAEPVDFQLDDIALAQVRVIGKA
jgi:hypothetical protein